MSMKEPTYREMMINTSQLEIPRATYQRELNTRRVAKIVKEFDERIANDPKVSYRNGHYYVFDGQHTIAARKQMRGGKDLQIRCKVFNGLTEADEATLFAQQFGTSAKLSAGAWIRALIYAGEPSAMQFKKIIESLDLRLDRCLSR